MILWHHSHSVSQKRKKTAPCLFDTYKAALSFKLTVQSSYVLSNLFLKLFKELPFITLFDCLLHSSNHCVLKPVYLIPYEKEICLNLIHWNEFCPVVLCHSVLQQKRNSDARDHLRIKTHITQNLYIGNTFLKVFDLGAIMKVSLHAKSKL